MLCRIDGPHTYPLQTIEENMGAKIPIKLVNRKLRRMRPLFNSLDIVWPYPPSRAVIKLNKTAILALLDTHVGPSTVRYEAPHRLQDGTKRGDVKAILRKPRAFDFPLAGLETRRFPFAEGVSFMPWRPRADNRSDEARPPMTVGNMRSVSTRLRGRPRIHSWQDTHSCELYVDRDCEGHAGYGP